MTPTFMPPTRDIPDNASLLSRQSSFVTHSTYIPHQTADDTSVASLVSPSRAPSLRRTASMAELELEDDIERALNRSTGTPAPVTVTSRASQGGSTVMSPSPTRRRRGMYSESGGSDYQTPSATDRPRSSFYSVSNLTDHDETSYVPTDTEEYTARGLRIAVDTLSGRGSGSVSMRDDTYDAQSTGYGSGLSVGVVSSAAYSRRRTLSAVSSPGTGLARSGGLRRPRRERAQTLSPTATDHKGDFPRRPLRLSLPRADPNPMARTRVSAHALHRTPESVSGGSQGPSTYGSIAYEICETSDISEFTID